MIDYERVSRLRALILELEHAAPSEERDALLRRARDRVLALESGAHEPSAWPVHEQGLSFPLRRQRARPEWVEQGDMVLD